MLSNYIKDSELESLVVAIEFAFIRLIQISALLFFSLPDTTTHEIKRMINLMCQA